MILLTSTSDLVKVITGSTGNIDVHASYVDITGSPPVATPGRTNTAQITTATTTTIVGSPGSSVQRNVKFLSLRNANASTSMGVTVEHYDGTTTTTLIGVTLQPGDSLQYNEVDGFIQIDAGGGLKMSPSVGRILKVTTETSGTTFTTGPSTNLLLVEAVGAGGAGGGCTSVAAAAAAAGGGGGGTYARKLFAVSPNTAYSYVIGTGGTGVSGAAGNAGGNTTFTVGSTTLTAPGGSGGAQAVANTALTTNIGANGGAAATNADMNITGQPGAAGITVLVAGPVMVSGQGGSSAFGSGGTSLTAAGTGTAGLGNGSGGSGSATGASAAQTGGAGTAGMLVLTEYT